MRGICWIRRDEEKDEMIEMTEMVSSRVARGRGGPGCEQNGTSGSRFGRGDSYVELSGGVI